MLSFAKVTMSPKKQSLYTTTVLSGLMNKTTKTTLIVCSIALLAVMIIPSVMIIGCSQKTTSQQAQSSTGTNSILIKNFKFTPGTLTVQKGDTVTWVNEDTAPHQISSDPHPGHSDLPQLASDILSSGKEHKFTFDKTGTFRYHCELHTSMKGTVIVVE